MSGAANCPETPRQKMIGMMYLVLTAMLALNVSADILNGFRLVNDSLDNSLETAVRRNAALYSSFEIAAKDNPAKVKEWLDKANEVKASSDSLFTVIENIKIDITKAADGDDYQPDTLIAVDNLDVAAQVALLPENNSRGAQLKVALGKYSELLQKMTVGDSIKQAQYAKLFATPNKWENRVFEMVPAIAAITVLSKYQNDIRNSEAEVVQYLRNRTDAGDYRVNDIRAVVIPESKYVMRGGKYSAQIILSATDSTKKPVIKVGGRDLPPSGLLEIGAGSLGSQSFSGVIELPNAEGGMTPYPFKSDYIVGEPSVTISADLMNVFYAGFNNTVTIAVPGVADANVNATMTGGTLTRSGKGWIAKPTRVGQNCVIKVTANIDGRSMNIGEKAFRVKQLPPPVAFIAYKDKGTPQKFKGGEKPFSKAFLIEADGIRAELDDADLDVNYRVLGFDITLMTGTGDALVYSSDSDRFTDRQRSELRRLTRGKTFFITRITAKGPDGIVRPLSPIQVKVN